MMLRSKSSRTFSAPKFCRGNDIGKSVDSHALKSIGRRKNPSKSERVTEIERPLAMQEHMGQLEEELKGAKDGIFVDEEEEEEEEGNEALNDNLMMKGYNESFSANKVGELMTEIRNLNEMLSNSIQESKMKDKNLESMRNELQKGFDVKLKEKDSILIKLKEELNKVKASEAIASNQASNSRKRIEDLEDEVQKSKVSEAKMLDSLKSLTKQLEQEKVEVEESKLKIASFTQKIVSLEDSIKQKHDDHVLELLNDKREPHDQDEEMRLLKKELSLALLAEEKSKKAMDDLAVVLKEVATESHQLKERLQIKEFELGNVKRLLDEAKKEGELHKNAAERLRLEAEESHFAWNGKEMGFVSCIKRAEEERAVLQHEKNRLVESLKAAEHMGRASREESYKLRDLLKQAINEANAAKATAGIANNENTQLKDLLAEKDEAMHFLTRENERLRISETAAYENIKEFKRLLSKASKKHKSHDTLKLPNPILANHEEQKKARKTISFDLGELNLYNDFCINADQNMEGKDNEKAEALKGTIFDPDASPRSEPRTPKPAAGVHQRRESSVFTDDEETTNSEDIDHVESSNFEDSDSDRNHTRRKTMFRRVGELIKRKSFHKAVVVTTDQQPTSHT